jgi:type VI secretion system secreted protein VgrG
MSVAALGEADQGSSGRWMAASMDDYQVLPPHAGDDHEDLFKLGQLRMLRHDYETKCFHAEGSVRDLCVGEYFTLEGHPEISSHLAAERDFTVTALQVTAQNNLPKALAERVERLFARNRWMRKDADGAHDAQLQQELAGHVAEGSSRMHIQFTAVRRGVPIVPAYDPRTELPQPQMQSAIVVGPEGEEVHCDEMGRVKIRFPATRAQDHTDRDLAGTTNDEYDSAWVRVATNWAGNGPGHQSQCGTLGLPRIGSEVLVAFLGGDPDKPVIVGQLYNQEGLPPALSTMDGLPGNKHLSGIKSREIKGGRANQLRLDDTTGQISAQLASDHGNSQLNLGFLTQPKSQGYGEPRGQGAELRSEEAVAIRGVKGVLVSAAANPSDEQMERNELISVAELAQSVARQLSALAVQLAEDPADGPQVDTLIDRLKSWCAVPQKGGNSSGNTEPIVAVSAPSGGLVASQESLIFGAQATINTMSAEDTRIGAGGNLFMRSLKGISFLAYKLGVKLIAASGNVRIESRNGDVEILALKRIKLIANEGIEFHSPCVKIVAQGAQAKFADGQITQESSGKHTIKSATFDHLAGSDGSAEKNDFSGMEVEHDQQVLVTDQISDDPLPNRRYRITVEDGNTYEGVTNAEGLTERFSTSTAFSSYRIEILD